MKVEMVEEHPSGAKAQRFLASFCGTVETVPFQNPTFTTGFQALAQERFLHHAQALHSRY